MMHQNDDFDLASNPGPGPSYWTKRRKIVQSIDEIMSQISNSDGPDVTAEQASVQRMKFYFFSLIPICLLCDISDIKNVLLGLLSNSLSV